MSSKTTSFSRHLDTGLDDINWANPMLGKHTRTHQEDTKAMVTRNNKWRKTKKQGKVGAKIGDKGNFWAVANLGNDYRHVKRDYRDGMARLTTSKKQGNGFSSSDIWMLILIHKERGYFYNRWNWAEFDANYGYRCNQHGTHWNWATMEWRYNAEMDHLGLVFSSTMPNRFNVISILSILLNFDNMLHVECKVYFFHLLEHHDILLFYFTI